MNLFFSLFLKFEYLKIRIIFTYIFLDLGFQVLYLRLYYIWNSLWNMVDIGAN